MGDEFESGTQDQGSNRNAAQLPQVKPLPGDYGPTNMTSGLQENLDWLKRHFSFPLSSGLVIRKFAVGRSSTEGAVIYLEGQVDWQHLNRTVLDPLIANNKPDDAPLDAHTLMDQMVTDCQVSSNGNSGKSCSRF